MIDVAPIPAPPAQPGGFADNGIPEVLALDAERLLVLERSFAAGTGVTIKLYAVDLRGATDVSGFEALAAAVCLRPSACCSTSGRWAFRSTISKA